jgi:hypothetical protein
MTELSRFESLLFDHLAYFGGLDRCGMEKVAEPRAVLVVDEEFLVILEISDAVDA